MLTLRHTSVPPQENRQDGVPAAASPWMWPEGRIGMVLDAGISARTSASGRSQPLRRL
jgi:hypothetical protein